MTNQEIDEMLVEMSKTQRDVVEEIYLDGEEPLIFNEDLSNYTLEELLEELEEEEEIEFNI